MPVPKRRTSRAKRDRRRAHDALSVPALGKCPKCGAHTAPHRACPTCGEYRGRRVVAVADED
jgi:large subunit ribosomal protein L32